MTIFLCVVLGFVGVYMIASGVWIGLYGLYLIFRSLIGR